MTQWKKFEQHSTDTHIHIFKRDLKGIPSCSHPMYKYHFSKIDLFPKTPPNMDIENLTTNTLCLNFAKSITFR